MPIIRSKIPEVKCMVAGSGPEEEQLKHLAVYLGVSELIEWPGEIQNQDEFYKKLRVYIQPSKSESFGMAPLEAQSYGVPVVVSGKGALPEVIKDGEGGSVLAVTNGENIANSVIKLLTNTNYWGEMSIKAQLNSKKYSVNLMADAHAKIYDEVSR